MMVNSGSMAISLLAPPARDASRRKEGYRWELDWENFCHAIERTCAGWFLSEPVELTSNHCQAALAVDSVDWTDVQATLNGASDAYARLVSRYQQPIAEQMWRYLPHAGVLEDLVHDVFVEAYLSLPRFRGRSPFLHWLRKIAVRVGYRYWKSEAKRRGQLRLVGDFATAAANEPEAADEAARLYAILDRLNPRDRLVITLIHLEERSIAEAADLLGWSQAMVKVQAFRARRKLKKLLQEVH
jgi:RNA polymerase sigma-70 factor, ECF subfamily